MKKKQRPKLKSATLSKALKKLRNFDRKTRANEIIDGVYKRIESTWDSSTHCAELLELKKIIRELE